MKFLRIFTYVSCLSLFPVMAFSGEIPFPSEGTQFKTGTAPHAINITADLGPRPGFSGYYLAARHAQASQDWNTANYYFDIVARKDPANKSLSRRAMIIAMGAGDLNLAATYAAEVLSISPQDPLASLFLSAQALQKKDYNRARKINNSMAPGGIAEFVTPLLSSWIDASEGKFDTAHLKQAPIEAHHVAMIGKLLHQEGRALQFVNTVKKNMNGTADLKLADALYILGQTDDAKTMYQDLLNTNEARTYLIKERLRALNAAETTFLDVSSTAQGLSHAFLDMAQILFDQNSYDSARIFAYIGLKIAPDKDSSHILLAEISAASEQFEEAIAQYHQVSENSRHTTEIALKIAEIQEAKGDLDSAIKGLRTFNDAHPSLDIAIQIGHIQRRNQDYVAALASYNKAIDSFASKTPPEYWYLYYVRGITHEKLDDWASAETDLKTALTYRPNDPLTLNHLAFGWTERGVNLPKALEYLEKAAARRPADGHIQDSIGWALYKMNRFNDAIAPLEKAILYLPYDSVINEHLGDAYWQVGRKREALFQWQRALNHIKTDPTQTALLQQKLQSGIPANAQMLVSDTKTEHKITK